MPATEQGDAQRPIWLLIDPYINHLEPEIGEAAIFVLRRQGYDPRPYFMDCSIRLLVSEGLLDEAKKSLRRLLGDLTPRGAIPIVGLEPSELLLLRDEAPALLGDAWPGDLLGRCFLLDEFLLHEHKAGRLRQKTFPAINHPVYFHPHCHERVMCNPNAMAVFLDALFGIKAEIISTGCCGMGGDFGYRHSSLSKDIFHNNVRLPPGNGTPAALLVSGTGCRHQFEELGNAKPQHLAQFLRDILAAT